MDSTHIDRIANIEDRIWHLNVRAEEMRDAFPSSPAGSQRRVAVERDLATVRKEIRVLVREKRAAARIS